MNRLTLRPCRSASSKFKGVTRGRKGRWHAALYIPGGKSIRLGTFDTEDAAALAYDKAALEHLGPKCFLNLRDMRTLKPLVIADIAIVPCRDRSRADYGHYLIDAEDAPKVEPYYWNFSSGSMVGKSITHEVALSILLLGEPPSDHAIAHINGDPLDNRKANLAVIPVSLHAGRQRKQTRKTKSIYKGVRKAGGRWSAYMAHKYLGVYDTEEAAARAYDNAAREHFGIYAAVNFPRANEVGCLRRRRPVSMPLAA